MTRTRMLVLCGLSMSIGWGIRGNFGHEHGAMIAGALGTMAAVILSGRRDWLQRIAFFSLFGAIGWGFGGSISYMQVIAYTHSGHALSAFYGMAMLFVIGFLWGAIGGAGMSLPAFFSRERLLELFVPGIVLFGVLVLQDVAYDPLNAKLAGMMGRSFIADNANYRHDEPLYWFDTDWTSFLLSIVTLGLLALVRRRWDRGSNLLMYLCVGWWIGFLLFPNLLGLRMTPPRGDNWAGCVGLVGGLWVYFVRNRLTGPLWASIMTGLVGGIGFAGADLFKLIGVKTGLETNWHSVLEQTYGFINGLGIGAVMWVLARNSPPADAEPGDEKDAASETTLADREKWTSRQPWPCYRMATIISVLTVLALIPWLNLSKNSESWVKAKAFPETLYWLSTAAWHNLAWIAYTVMLLSLFIAHSRRPIAALQTSWLGRAQWLYLVFLWTFVVGNFERALPGFGEQRLITEGVILLNALLCSSIALIWSGSAEKERVTEAVPLGGWSAAVRRTALSGSACAAIFVVVSWGIVRLVWGDTFAGHAGKHIRFGPNATVYPKPKSGQPHP